MAKNGKKVGIISLEMNNNEIAARLSSIETQTDFKTIFRSLFEDENSKMKWYNKLKNLVNFPIYISDKTGVSAMNIKAKAQKLKHEIKRLPIAKLPITAPKFNPKRQQNNRNNR
mgnify:CR=1 FL=1